MSKKEEANIQNAILLAFTKKYHPNGIFWRQNAGFVITEKGKKVVLGPPGIADIVGSLFGFAIFCEVKASKGKQRKTQIAFQKAVEKSGGIYILARSPESALSQLEEAINLKRS